MSMRDPFESAAAWYASDVDKDTFSVALESRHLHALGEALDALKRAALARDALQPAHFPLAAIASEVDAWREEVRNGKGLLVLRGLPVDRYSLDDIEQLYFGLGLHFGRPVSQNSMGELLTHVENVGDKDRRERAYRNSRELELHTDRCDHVGMLCIRAAVDGGLSGYASALTIHNEILRTRPELLEHLYSGYRHHRFGEQAPGEPPITAEPIPLFSIEDGVPTVIYIRGYIDLAVAEGLMQLSDGEKEALDYFDEIANRPNVRVNFMMMPGDLAFYNNCTLLHTRTSFEDDPAQPEKNRLLMRLWLREDRRPLSAGARLHKGASGIVVQRGRGTYYDSNAWT